IGPRSGRLPPPGELDRGALLAGIDQQHERGLILHLGGERLHLFNSLVEQFRHAGSILVRGGICSEFLTREKPSTVPISPREGERSASAGCSGLGRAGGGSQSCAQWPLLWCEVFARSMAGDNRTIFSSVRRREDRASDFRELRR